ncbi:uncharacterized protein L969DRAFT_92707 [Mixia osmundae IAM 14324]|uniref:Cytochrome c oxidase assembly protein COX16, mitochondrial n=1 Tax=Mixia osmundae (strain CBS 9802 / IAM 14324 / JCM 22182 / KY 12970) TaxID=764103 RepID=G7DYB5_MIXOS|nr:uncharacterized protein L969DRAFT_92707 [Mixia osmundae IAM 14324]KEI41477.1 hypothetical protein L969DRAFT_92707 [Mixia osmundae IAM 14324]GAA95575.1 hypothetical protein E5Q_02230 [Mixia osmundae IAM 14324]
MNSLPSKPLKRAKPGGLNALTRRYPFLLFGLPFVLTIVGGSFALSSFTQTRYDLKDSKVRQVSQEEELNMSKSRKKVDLREEYFRLRAQEDELDEWENKRISRLPGQAQWGDMAPPPTQKQLQEQARRS